MSELPRIDLGSIFKALLVCCFFKSLDSTHLAFELTPFCNQTIPDRTVLAFSLNPVWNQTVPVGTCASLKCVGL